MTDDTVEELGDRTPLEIAKTPHLKALAASGVTGAAQFVPRALAPTDDVAFMSILGYDPAEFFTGTAPLEAVSLGVPQNDNEIAFRCDLVTVLDDALIDTGASRISPKESRILIEELNKKLGSSTVRFYPGDGHKNILLISDPNLTDHLDDLECTDPKRLVGKAFAKYLPAGKSAKILTDLMDKSKEVLDSQEINRVRIDLGENPANMIWPWGQGRKPKMPSFKQRFSRSAAMVSQTDFVRGLAKLLDIDVKETVDDALASHDVVFVYMPFDDEIYRTNNLKSKIKLIEDFDFSVVGPALKSLGSLSDARVLVATDRAWSRTKQAALHGQVPFLLAGHGVSRNEGNVFSEKASAQSKLVFEEGHKLMGYAFDLK